MGGSPPPNLQITGQSLQRNHCHAQFLSGGGFCRPTLWADQQCGCRTGGFHQPGRNGYPLGSGKAIYIVGYSGGGQIAVGVADPAHSGADVPIRVVSLGGVISDDPGIADVDHLYHIEGEKYPMPKLGGFALPGAMAASAVHSKLNQAKRVGRITVGQIGAYGPLRPQ